MCNRGETPIDLANRLGLTDISKNLDRYKEKKYGEVYTQKQSQGQGGAFASGSVGNSGGQKQRQEYKDDNSSPCRVC